MASTRNRKKKAKTIYTPSKPGFKVLIYDREYRQIQEWTDMHHDLETGGDLFGLWQDDRTAVVQLVLGPGKNCQRTTHSFYQDVDYLERVGNHLTRQEGLCHIGEWHSHHRLGLSRPSGGDENTVWTNMRRYGINRFCLFISTIRDEWSSRAVIQDHLDVNGYLFEINGRNGSEMPLLECTFELIQETSPFRLSNEQEIIKGAERMRNTAKGNYGSKNLRTEKKSPFRRPNGREVIKGNERMNTVKDYHGNFRSEEMSPEESHKYQQVEVSIANQSKNESICQRVSKLFHCYLCPNCIVNGSQNKDKNVVV